jgi:hypothetical protein
MPRWLEVLVLRGHISCMLGMPADPPPCPVCPPQAYITKLKDFKSEMYGDLYGEKPYKMERVTVEQTLDVREEPFQH